MIGLDTPEIEPAWKRSVREPEGPVMERSVNLATPSWVRTCFLPPKVPPAGSIDTVTCIPLTGFSPSSLRTTTGWTRNDSPLTADGEGWVAMLRLAGALTTAI
jgi:hypothetical protein